MGFELLNVIKPPRTRMVHMDCSACGGSTPVGLPDKGAALPLRCSHCCTALPNDDVLMANLILARAETEQLGAAVGSVLKTIAGALQEHPTAAAHPLELVRRVVDETSFGRAGAEGYPYAAFVNAIMR